MGINVAGRVFDLACPVAENLGLTVWDVRYVKEGASYYLRIYIDKPGGIGIDDCTKMSQAMDPVLDEADLIDRAYYLEVCSTGLERELNRDEHFELMRGREVNVSLYKAKDGVKRFCGVLSRHDKESVTILCGGEEITFLKSEISKVKLNDGID
jgi:ribosome maturation factor rimP